MLSTQRKYVVTERLKMERRHLADAERQIVSGELYVTTQRVRIDELERGGDPSRAREILHTFLQSLDNAYDHRRAILYQIHECERLLRDDNAS